MESAERGAKGKTKSNKQASKQNRQENNSGCQKNASRSKQQQQQQLTPPEAREGQVRRQAGTARLSYAQGRSAGERSETRGGKNIELGENWEARWKRMREGRLAGSRNSKRKSVAAGNSSSSS